MFEYRPSSSTNNPGSSEVTCLRLRRQMRLDPYLTLELAVTAHTAPGESARTRTALYGSTRRPLMPNRNANAVATISKMTRASVRPTRNRSHSPRLTFEYRSCATAFGDCDGQAIR